MTSPADQKSDLLARLRGLEQAREGQPKPEGQIAPTTKSGRKGLRRADFAEHPEYLPTVIQRRAAEELGIASPYFRLNEMRPGAQARYNGGHQINYATYDYLGLNGHPEVTEAAKQAIDQWGVSSTASRVAGGERPYHRALEEALAAAYGVEDCVVMVSGHATNVTSIGCLVGPKDLIIADTLSHNSVTEGVRLSGATRLTMPHNDYDWLEETLERVRGRYRYALIAVEGLYSMDGDCTDLPRLIDIKHRHDAWLMVDEAHTLGVLGKTGRGTGEHQSVDPREVDIWMGTLSKAMGASGGYICGSAALVDFLKSRASGFVFSVGLSAPVAVSAQKALEIMLREPERVARLQANGRLFLESAQAAGLNTGRSEGHAVTPVMVGDSLTAVRLSNAILERGVNAIPIIFPAVPERDARLRFFLTAMHDPEDIRSAATVTAEALAAL